MLVVLSVFVVLCLCIKCICCAVLVVQSVFLCSVGYTKCICFAELVALNGFVVLCLWH